MNNKFKYIFTIVVSIFVGCGIMYCVMQFFPNTVVKSIEKQEVSINDTGIKKSVEKVYDSVIYVSADLASGASTGTGFVYKKDKKNGYIITNYHVVNGAKNIRVLFSDDSEATAKYIGGDQYADIAILTVDAGKVKSVVKTGKSTDMALGDTVFTIGAPMGLDYKGTVTKGILSGKDRLVSVSLGDSTSNDWVMNVMQTDAAINPGNSGGPLCNINGEVIGVNSLKIVKNEVEGLGFSIPIEEALSYANKIEKNIDTKRPYLGVEMLNITDGFQLAYRGINVNKKIDHGVVIVNVENKSPAFKAGIKSGDVIQKVGSDKVKDIAEFRYYLYKHNPGEKVMISINRNGKVKEVSVTLKAAN